MKTPQEAIEVGMLVACLLVTSAVVFTRQFATAAPHPFEYAVFPWVIWAAVRFGVAGVSIANVLIAAVAVWGTVQGLGPYAAGQGDERLMLLQVFMGTVAGSGLILGAAISERDASKARKAGMLEASLDPIITIDHLGGILEFNPAAERTFGYREDEVVGREMAGLLIPDHLRATITGGRWPTTAPPTPAFRLAARSRGWAAGLYRVSARHHRTTEGREATRWSV